MIFPFGATTLAEKLPNCSVHIINICLRQPLHWHMINEVTGHTRFNQSYSTPMDRVPPFHPSSLLEFFLNGAHSATCPQVICYYTLVLSGTQYDTPFWELNISAYISPLSSSSSLHFSESSFSNHLLKHVKQQLQIPGTSQLILHEQDGIISMLQYCYAMIHPMWGSLDVGY